MIKERGISPFGPTFGFIGWNPMCYGGSLSLPPVFCRSFTGRSFRSIDFDQVRGSFLDVASGPLDAPETLPAGSHMGEWVTCNGQPLMRKAQTIYAREVPR